MKGAKKKNNWNTQPQKEENWTWWSPRCEKKIFKKKKKLYSWTGKESQMHKVVVSLEI